MSKMIFVSLPVTDLKASMAFYESIGFKNNPQFTDETAACMVWSEAINFMLLTHAKWRTFTTRPIPPKTSSEVMLALSCDSRDARCDERRSRRKWRHRRHQSNRRPWLHVRPRPR